MDDSGIKILHKAIGSFVIIDYETANGIDTAKGGLESVSEEGNILVRHLNNPQVFWTFHISQVKNSKFSPIKQKEGDNHESASYKNA